MVKKNLTAILCAALGLFAFIFSAFSFVGCEISAGALSGYDLIGEELGEFKCGGILPIVQIVMLIVGGLMLVCGVLALLKDLGKINLGLNVAGIAKILLAAMAVLSILQLVFVIIFVADVNKMLDMYKIGFGAILAVILSVGAYVVALVAGKNGAASSEE